MCYHILHIAVDVIYHRLNIAQPLGHVIGINGANETGLTNLYVIRYGETLRPFVFVAGEQSERAADVWLDYFAIVGNVDEAN